MQFGYWLIGEMHHISIVSSQDARAAPFAAPVHLLDK
jgi:hypothetical protein